MTGARTRRLRGSLGDSWGDAEYSSDGGASIESTSDLLEAGSDNETGDYQFYTEDADFATPVPARVTRASSKTPQNPQNIPVSPSANRIETRQSDFKFAHGPDSPEPSFIMPSMSGSDGLYNSPLRKSRKAQSHNQAANGASYSPPSYRSSPTGMVISRSTDLLQDGSPNVPQASGMRYRRGPSTMSSSQNSVDQRQNESRGPWGYVELFWQHVLWPLAKYVTGVISYAFELMKPFFGFLLFIIMVCAALYFVSGFLHFAAHRALAPVCTIPGSSYILPFCESLQRPGREHLEPDFDELVNAQTSFEDILQSSMDAYALPRQMKQTEAAVRDLRTLVKYSKLPSKEELLLELGSFIELAREIVTDLTRYNGKVGLTMDKIISTNRHTLQVIHGETEKDASLGSLDHVTNWLYYSFSSRPSMQQLVFAQYTQHVSKIREEINGLITRALALLRMLQNLEDRLSILGDIANRDRHSVNDNRDEVLSYLWTKVGGNRKSLQKHDQALRLLQEVLLYEKRARTHVADTLLKLQTISAALENLGESVSEPEIAGYSSNMPLTYWIDIIEAGVVRLESARGESRRLEAADYQKSRIEDYGNQRIEDPNALPGPLGDGPTVRAPKSKGEKRKH